MHYLKFLDRELANNPNLKQMIALLFKAVVSVSENIDISKAKTDTMNVSGDTQLEMDVLADVIIHDTLLESDLVSIIASEEREDEVLLSGTEFAVVYDPLDGSSLIDANFAIGTIFGVYPGTHLVGRTPRDMVASMYSVYGPRTTVVVTWGAGVHEFILKQDGFHLSRENMQVSADSKYFAPGNLRACNSNPNYKNLVQHWVDSEYTLRYSGGMVPDINHIFIKQSGIFAYPKSKDAPEGKLRLLYECGPMAFLMTQAGGSATNGHSDILDLPIASLHQKSPIFLGSSNEVAKVEQFGA